jgi:toxin YoeB
LAKERMSRQELEIIVDRNFLEDLTYWVSTDHKTAGKILDLVEAIRRDPFAGIGKPESLSLSESLCVGHNLREEGNDQEKSKQPK